MLRVSLLAAVFLLAVGCSSICALSPPSSLLALKKSKKMIHATPTGNLTLISSGYRWAENLWFAAGALFVSDDFGHKIYKLERTGHGAAARTLWLDGSKASFTSVLGLHTVPGSSGREMLAVVKSTSGPAVFVFSTSQQGEYRLFAKTPVLGNGIAVDNASGAIYLPDEGDFIPGRGVVMSSSGNDTRSFKISAKDLYAADGAWLDQESGLLFVSEVLEGKILVYKTDAAGTLTQVAEFKAPGCDMVDDFCLIRRKDGSNTADFFAADFWADKVVRFTVDLSNSGKPVGGSGSPKVLASGLRSPTSVRPAVGTAWNEGHSVFVTEGGGVEEFDGKQRVWELHL